MTLYWSLNVLEYPIMTLPIRKACHGPPLIYNSGAIPVRPYRPRDCCPLNLDVEWRGSTHTDGWDPGLA